MKKIAIQGARASFHDIAARQYFKNPYEIIECDLPFKTVFDVLENGHVDFAVCAIENSLYGSINEVYDLLIDGGASIIGEIYLRIEQSLIGLADAKLSSIKEIHSHPIALAQCEKFLDSKIPHAARFEQHDTAQSVAFIKKWNDSSKVAIASSQAAELHGLKILRRNIETNHQNYTRFVILENKPPKVMTMNGIKSSLVLQTHGDTKPGALYRALGVFNKHQLNLTLLHSRPIVGKAWHYVFYIDVIGNGSLGAAMSELKESGCTVKRLGSYLAGKVS